ncbi:kinase [Thraustotheca clavata]|uniref:Kinase n=1 Tax=Thraustotheca clavata TaxID=74557 RepID=A0A1W0AC50_9STRA|nr:kinase [Thraustotheca clavata]
MSNWLERSDYVARFLDLYNRKVNSAKLNDLPQHLQQGLLWDMGLVVGNVDGTDTYLQVYTKCGITMASIGLTMDKFRPVNNFIQTKRDCTINVDGSAVLVQRQEVASFTLVDQVAKCAMKAVSLSNAKSSILSQDGLGANAIPEPRVWCHVEPSTKFWYSQLFSFVFGIDDANTEKYQLHFGEYLTRYFGGTDYNLQLIPARHCRFTSVDTNITSAAINVLYQTPCLQTKQLNFNDVILDFSIAAGAYGETFIGTHKTKQAAIKRAQKHRFMLKGAFQSFCEEIKLMGHLQHPNIVFFYGYCWDLRSPATLSAVIEYLSDGDLKLYLESNPDLSWATKIVYAVDVAKALQYLHEQQEYLMDLLHGKLSDFGISREQVNDGTLTVGVGTAYYSATEKPICIRLDVYWLKWSHTGLYSGLKMQPFNFANKIIHENFRPTVSDYCPRVIYDLVKRCFEADPKLRPTASEAVQLLEK